MAENSPLLWLTILQVRSSGRALLAGSRLITVVSAKMAAVGKSTAKTALSTVCLAPWLFSYHMASHLPGSAWYGFLMARQSQGRWVSSMVAGYPQSIQFKLPGEEAPSLLLTSHSITSVSFSCQASPSGEPRCRGRGDTSVEGAAENPYQL